MRRASALALAVALGACHRAPPPTTLDAAAAGSLPPSPSYPGRLLDPAQMRPDFMARQRVHGQFADREVAFEAVVQKRGDELFVLVLTPYGSRALLARQAGQEVEVETFIPAQIPLTPRWILLDVQRSFFVALPGAPLSDGWHRGVIGDEVVREHWRGGALFRREFRRTDGRPQGTIAVHYKGGFVLGTALPDVELHNGWLGYRLRIETLAYHPL